MLKKIVGTLFQILGLGIGLSYLPQAYSIWNDPNSASHVSLITFGFICFSQVVATLHGYLNDDHKLVRAFGLACGGSLTVVVTILWGRYIA